MRPIPTLIVGAVGGLVVGMTSVGSGSLIIVSLMLMYPAITAPELVGTDLVQGVPLVAAAALAHILFGNFQLGLTAALVLGSVPGVYLGARFSSRAPDGLVRPVLVFVLLSSALKLLGLSTPILGWSLLVLVMVGLPVWALVDALQWSKEHWEGAGRDRRAWIRLQAIGAICLIGVATATAYFAPDEAPPGRRCGRIVPFGRCLSPHNIPPKDPLDASGILT